MIVIEGQIVGDKDMELLFDRLADTLGESDAASGLAMINYEVMEPVETEIRSNTPVDTGILRDSVGREFDERYTDRTGYPSVVTGWLARRTKGRTIRKQVKAGVAVEFIHGRRVVTRAIERQQSSIFVEWIRRFNKFFDDAVVKSARGTQLQVKRGA